MNIKKDASPISSADFWDDLIEGGYIEPEDFLDNVDDAQRVRRAINVLRAYRNVLEESGIVEEM